MPSTTATARAQRDPRGPGTTLLGWSGGMTIDPATRLAVHSGPAIRHESQISSTTHLGPERTLAADGHPPSQQTRKLVDLWPTRLDKSPRSRVASWVRPRVTLRRPPDHHDCRSVHLTVRNETCTDPPYPKRAATC